MGYGANYGLWVHDITITTKELCRELNISRGILTYWMNNCIPDIWKFRKAHDEDFPNGRYIFDNDDFRVLGICRDLKQLMTAAQVKIELLKYIEDRKEELIKKGKINI